MRELSAHEFKKLALSGFLDLIEVTCVVGEVSFRGETIPKTFRVWHVFFTGAVDFTDARIEGSLDLTGCRFHRILSLKNLEVDGELVLDEISVEAAGKGNDGSGFDSMKYPAAVDAEGIVVHGSLQMSSVRVEGHVSLDDAHVHGRLVLSGISIQGNLVADNLKCDSDVVIHKNESERVSRPGAILGELSIKNSRIGGNLALIGIYVGNGCQFWSSQIGGNIWIQGLLGSSDILINGDVHLGSTTAGSLYIEGIAITGQLLLFHATFAAIRIGYLQKSAESQASTIGSILADGLRVTNDVSLYGVTLMGLGAGTRATASFQSVQVGNDLKFWSANIFVDDGKSENPYGDMVEACGCTIVGDLDLSGSVVGGDCDLTAITVDGGVLLDDAKVTGDILFRSSASILSEILFKERFRSLYHRLEQNSLSRTGDAKTRDKTQRKPVASIRRLSMTNVQCSNDVDLSGIQLRACIAELDGKSPYGSIAARGLTVAGKLWLVQGSTELEHAEIPGSANFQSANINHVRLSAYSFEQGITDYERKDVVQALLRRGLVLDNAVIKKLEVVSIPGSRQMFPVPASLADIIVGQWDVAGTDSSRIDRYLSILEADPVYRRSTYIHVEKNLRNQGHESEADQIYRAMSRRALAGHHKGSGESRYLWGLFFKMRKLHFIIVSVVLGTIMLAMGLPNGENWIWFAVAACASWFVWPLLIFLIWDILLGFGTTPMRSGILILILFVFSTVLVYSHPENIGRTLPAATVTAVDGVTESLRKNVTLINLGGTDPLEKRFSQASKRGTLSEAVMENSGGDDKPNVWTQIDALAIGLRAHVPLASWALRDNWQLSDDQNRKLVIGFPAPGSEQYIVTWARPEDFGMLMMVLNFLLWPPFLAFLLRRAFRYA